MNYQHTQPGHLILWTLLFVVLFFVGLLVYTEIYESVFIMLFVILLLTSFASLTVTIDAKDLRIQFGYGIYKKCFDLRDIASSRIVRNKWYFGWGIRVWFWPYMWIFNVSGFNAIEIKLKNGKIYRIGTDEPKELEQAIQRSIK